MRQAQSVSHTCATKLDEGRKRDSSHSRTQDSEKDKEALARAPLCILFDVSASTRVFSNSHGHRFANSTDGENLNAGVVLTVTDRLAEALAALVLSDEHLRTISVAEDLGGHGRASDVRHAELRSGRA